MEDVEPCGGRGDSTDESAATADQLAHLHFTLHKEETPGLDDVDVVALDPFLRGLLFTDGTVSRALEAQTLSHVTVRALDQVTVPVPAPAARDLGVKETTDCMRRRVTMHIAADDPAVWAESYIVPERLPQDFVAQLSAAPQGIGGSLQQMKLESWRELLRFGLGSPPPWTDAASEATTLTRSYRIITQGLPALLITESFVIEMRSGLYHLIGSDGAGADDVAAVVR